MRTFILTSVVLALGCSSSGSDKSGTAAVDPAAEDFCLHWANGVCRLAYQCVDPGAQDAAFHSRYGASQEDCWQSVEKYCTSNQTGSGSFGPSCGPGKKVNDALSSACTDGLEAESCSAWTALPAGPCDTVCSSASNTGGAGGAGSGGAGPGSGGGSANTGSLATAADFCLAEESVQCERAFECQPTAAAAVYGTVAGCKAAVASECASGGFCTGGYDASKAAGCVAAAKTATCAQLMGDAPEVCTSACK
ncbi:MAG TPA: hypothetical protein VGC79_35105 [Polyangiaceae bacterium]